MSNPAPICTHIKTDGIRCGSPAVSGTDFCHHHSAVKTALAKAPTRRGRGEFEPIPFVFPEDRASMQVNYYLLMQAFNEGRIDLKNYKALLGMLKSMAKNLGKTGSLVDDEARAQGSGRRAQKDREQEDSEENDPFADLRHLPKPEFNAAVRERAAQWREEERAEEERKLAATR